MTESAIQVAFVCVENAGRSQMAAAFARQASDRRAIEGVQVRSGGTDPAESVHEVVIEAMAERDIDVSDREPRLVGHEEIMDVDVLVTMGCSADDVCPATWRGDSRDWDLDDPAGQPLPAVRAIRDQIEKRVNRLLDEIVEGD